MALLCAGMLTLSGCTDVVSSPVAATPAAATAPLPAPAAVAVYVTASNERPIADVLVTLRPADGKADTTHSVPAALDLMQRSFEPQVLAVPVGTQVTIHNLDDVDHEIYSFSPALPFSLHLAAKGGHGAVTAAHAGVVVLGCKVHDEMVGYLYVTDAPYFGKTDSRGYLRLAGLKPGRYLLGIWRADKPDADAAHLKPLTLSAGDEEAVRLRL